MKSLQDVLNEDSAAEIQADKAPGQGDSKNLIPLKAGKFNKRSLIRTMKKPEGVIQTSDGKQFTIVHVRIDGNTDMWGDESVFGIDQDGGEVEINYDDIASYSETRDEDDAMVVRSMTYDNADMPKTKVDLLTAMKRELRGMKVADLKASYQYIKGAHCNTKEGMQGIGTKRDMLTAMMKDLRGMKKDALTASYGYIKSAHCQPHEGDMVNASSCTSEATELEEMKTKDDELAVMIYDFIGADTEGLPLKTLIHQAVGKYFGSQKEKKEEAEMHEGGDLQEAKMSQGVKTATRQIYSLENSLKVGSNLNKGINRSLQGKYDADFKEMEKSIGTIINVWGEIERDFSDPDMNEARVTSTSTSYKAYDATTELMRAVNSLVDEKELRTKWGYDIDEKGPVNIEGSSFPLHKSATLKIYNVRGEDPFTVEQKNYLMDVYKQSQKGSAFGRGSKWHKMEFSRDGMEATAKIDIQPKEILNKNQ
jgi:hypothetical protein